MSNTSLLGSYGGQAGDGLFFRNRILNGCMRIDQRNAGAKVTLDSKFGVDRFVQFIASNFFTAGLQQKTDTPPTGFSHYLRVSADTAGTATAAQYAFLAQAIEGFNVSDLAWGTSSATAVSLSFWARSSLTGTFSGSIKNNTEDRSYVFSFSISAANTWEYKTITIPGCPDGTWDKATNAGFRISWDYGSGSARRSTAGAWLSGSFNGATGSVSLSQTLNATLDLTGVQLEAGPTATPFERRPYSVELGMCQRYYWRESAGLSSSYKAVVMPLTTTRVLGAPFCLPVPLRNSSDAGLTVAHSGVVLYNYALSSAVNVTNILAYSSAANATHITLDMTCNALGGTSQPYLLALNGGTGFIAISAEL